MFRGDRYTKPKPQSFVGALIVAVLAWMGTYISSVIGYFIALLCMVMIIVALNINSIWPRERENKRILLFSPFSGAV